MHKLYEFYTNLYFGPKYAINNHLCANPLDMHLYALYAKFKV
jgi:hypothetical protein